MNIKCQFSRKTGKPTVRTVLEFYDVFLRCDDITKGCAALEIDRKAYYRWVKEYSEFRIAKEMADEARATRNTFSGYIYQRLSPESRELWKRLEFWDRADNAYEKINQLLSGRTKAIKQELFVHALIHTNFDLSTACRMVGVTRQALDGWKRDLEFTQLIEEIQWHKKNFFEKALIDLVETRHPSATIFVNKTINADRGYNPKIEIDVSGQIDRVGLDIDELDLDLDTKRKILDAIRRKKESVNDVNPLQIVDVEAA